MNKYESLEEFLCEHDADTWAATFAEVEAILGFRLPTSARRYQAWWANNLQGSRHSCAWLNAGWRTGDLDLARERVVFSRESSELGQSLLQARKDRPAAHRAEVAADTMSYASEQSQSHKCTLGMEWKPLGKVSLDTNSRLMFPAAPKVPAIYCIRIHGGDSHALYIGETDNLARRFGNYRHPGPTQQTSLRINARLRESLAKHAEITIAAVLADAWVDCGVGKQRADFTSKVVRCLFENAAILSFGGIDVEMLNKARS